MNVFCPICLRLAPNDGMQWGYDRDDENHQTPFFVEHCIPMVLGYPNVKKEPRCRFKKIKPWWRKNIEKLSRSFKIGNHPTWKVKKLWPKLLFQHTTILTLGVSEPWTLQSVDHRLGVAMVYPTNKPFEPRFCGVNWLWCVCWFTVSHVKWSYVYIPWLMFPQLWNIAILYG